MASPWDGASVETLREAARLYVDATSLRNAARTIGMSPTGLRGFVDGADPYIKTTRKLTEWYVSEIHNRSAEVSTESAGAALSLLVAHLAPSKRKETVDGLLAVLERRCRETDTAIPAWLARMRGDSWE
jgi:hypothetical protein